MHAGLCLQVIPWTTRRWTWLCRLSGWDNSTKAFTLIGILDGMSINNKAFLEKLYFWRKYIALKGTHIDKNILILRIRRDWIFLYISNQKQQNYCYVWYVSIYESSLSRLFRWYKWLKVTSFQNGPGVTELYLGHNNLGYDGGKLLATELGRRFSAYLFVYNITIMS